MVDSFASEISLFTVERYNDPLTRKQSLHLASDDKRHCIPLYIDLAFTPYSSSAALYFCGR